LSVYPLQSILNPDDANLEGKIGLILDSDLRDLRMGVRTILVDGQIVKIHSDYLKEIE